MPATKERLKLDPPCPYEGSAATYRVRDARGGVYGYACTMHVERMLAEANVAESLTRRVS